MYISCSKQYRFNCNETTSFSFFFKKIKIQNDVFISNEMMSFLFKVKRRCLFSVDSVRSIIYRFS
jgi:hypothetical protein